MGYLSIKISEDPVIMYRMQNRKPVLRADEITVINGAGNISVETANNYRFVRCGVLEKSIRDNSTEDRCRLFLNDAKKLLRIIEQKTGGAKEAA